MELLILRNKLSDRLLATARSLPFICAAVFALALTLRAPRLVLRPRFWAEEAWVFMPAMQEGHLHALLTFTFRGNYQLFLNVSAYLATLVPGRYAAHVTTYLAGAVSVYAAYLLGRFVREVGGQAATAALAGALLAFQPAGFEIFLTATNVQWVCALTVLLLSQLPLSRCSLGFRTGNAVWLVACGLTGIPSIVVLPVLLLEAVRQRSRWHVYYAGLLGLCGSIQATILLLSPHDPDRIFTLSPRALVPLLLQTVFVHWAGLDVTNLVGEYIRAAGVRAGLPVMAACASIVTFALYLSSSARARVSILLIGWLGITTVYLFGSLTSIPDLMRGGGGRYFFVGSICLLLVVVAAAGARSDVKRVLANGMLAAMLTIAVCDAYTGGWVGVFIAGPSVAAQLKACHERRPCPVTAAPYGTPKTIMLQ